MAIDTGARSHGRAASRIGPTHTNTRAPVTRAARSYQRTVGDSSQRVNLGNPRLTTAQRIASVPPKRKATLKAALSRVLKAYKSGPRYGSTFSPDEAASLVKSVGGSTSEAQALSTKIVGESGGNPKAVGHDPGGTTGLGLWQLTTGVGNDSLINKYGGTSAMLKPKPNAKAALDLFRSGGLSNWYAGSNAPGNPSKVPPKVKPDSKDVHKLQKAGISTGYKSKPKPVASGPSPFKKAVAKSGSGSGIRSNLKWAPGESLNAGINPVVKKWAKTYGASLTAGYDPGGGHVSPGHNTTGTATDMVPAGGWGNPQAVHHFEQGLRVLANSGFEVLYGTDGIGHAYPNHGRGNHAHIEWANVGAWSAGSSAALQKLGGLSDSQIKQIQNTKGSGAGSLSSTASAVTGYASSTGQTPKAAAKSLAKMSPHQRQMALRAALNKTLRGYGGIDSASHTSSSSPLTHVSGKPVV